MKQAELDGLVLTEHDAYWSADDLAALRRSNPAFRIYCGIEITASDGHVIAIGASRSLVCSRAQSIQSIAEMISALGGCAIWVHPFQNPQRWTQAASAIHAIEVFSTVTSGIRSKDAIRLAHDLGRPCVAGSDAHAIDHLGTAGVVLDELPDSEAQLALLLRLGRARPFRHRLVAASPVLSG